MQAFASIDDALAYIEPIDVDGGEYEAFDADGRLIVLGTVFCGRLGAKRVVIRDVEESPTHDVDLRRRLVAFLDRAGAPTAEPNGDLASVVAKFQAWNQEVR